MSYNFFGPTFEAKIRTPENKELFLGPRKKITKDSVPIATQLEVKTGLGQNVEISLTLKPHSREMGLALIGDKKFDPENGPELSKFIRIGHHLVVRWGYAGNPEQQSEWYAGMMTKPDVSLGDEVDITLRAQGFQWWAFREYQTKQWGGQEEGPPAPMTALEIIEEIAKKHGWKIDELAFEKLPLDMQLVKTTDYVQSNVSDWMYVKNLCRKYAVHVTMSKGSELKLHPMKADSELKPVAKFVYGSKVYGDGIYPITGNIETSTDLLFIPVRGEVKTRILDVLTKTPKEEKADPSTTEEPTIQGSGGVANAETGGAKKDTQTEQYFSREKMDKESAGMFIPQAARESQLKSTINGLYSTMSAERAGLPIEFPTLGVPTIEPGLIIELDVGATFFSGVFKVQEVTHTVGDGGYDMQLKCMSHGIPDQLISEAMKGENAAGQANVEADTSSGGNQKTPKTNAAE